VTDTAQKTPDAPTEEPSGPVTTSATTGEPVRRFSGPWFAALALRNAMLIVVVLVICYFSYRSLRFTSVDNLTTILIAAAPFALIALGQTLVILTGGIDLSVGSVIAMSAMAAAAVAKANPGQVWMTVLTALVVGLLFVSVVSVPP
jgi:ribose transport system permease protein